MTFRTDTLVNRTRKPHRCDWCGEWIPEHHQMVRASGRHEDFWTAKLHPECWRAEQVFWLTKADLDDGWAPGDAARGRTDDDREAGREFTDRPITLTELRNPTDHKDSWTHQLSTVDA
ncbi:MAG: hypothetical protein IT581_06495 [Verrucomicrobiales bacterium]|nr:hypothetical protein [Verrucomicrobiales bacterium]